MRFRLQKYSGMSSRYTCPACKRSKKFTRYVDTMTGEHVSDEVGRCDRESACGYHMNPRDFFAERNDGPEPPQQSRIRRRRGWTTPREPDIFGTEPYPESNRIGAASVLESLEASRYSRNHFLNFLLNRFRGAEATVINAFKEYLVGTGLHGETIFWQIDERRVVRTGSVMMFDPATGKRRKDRNPNWIHAMLKRAGELPETFELRQCFFGQHLLQSSPGKPLAIVEAAKTAVVATICKSAFPNVLWLATGGKHGLAVDKLRQVAIGRRVLLYPDLDAIEVWEDLAKKARQLGLDVRVSTIVRDLAPELGLSEGADIADCLIAIQSRDQADQDDSLLELVEERIAIMTVDGRVSEEEARAYVLGAGPGTTEVCAQ